MIVRIEASGTSFLGAGRYFLHDKLSDQQKERVGQGDWIGRLEQTDQRVWFTDTRNCLNTDPERALEEMWMVAEDQARLKMQAGVARGGRPCTEPVKTISLSWHKDDRPDAQHMVEAADAFLKHMRWEQHQAVYVAHNDTEHRHIHIVLNRVNHENGRTIDDFKDHKRAQSWALSYEKEQENVRCEERERRAAKREHREPSLPTATPGTSPAHQHDAKHTPRTPANDHLPHNVIMLSREHERAFSVREREREIADRDQRAELKAAQRAERKAFFKDGAKQFKALRHDVYDEVRKEYAPEWRELYKATEAASRSAEAWSASSVSRALYFAKDGKWESAANAFADRNGVRDALATELYDRKQEIKARQTEDLRERQREACDALRERRDAEYQDLLQRQREERGALAAGVTLDAIGMGRDRGLAHSEPVASNQLANENRRLPIMQLDAARAAAPELGEVRQLNHDVITGAARETSATPTVTENVSERIAPESSPVVGPLAEAPEVTRQIADLAAGGIGQAASYLADQLGEMFAPTPPEVREAQAKAAAKHEAEKPPAPEKPDPYAKIIASAARLAEEERASAKGNIYWKERDRGKGWERDQ